MKKFQVFAWLVIPVVLGAAELSVEQTASVRSDRKVGFQVLNMGAPYQQTLGVAAAVNVMRKVRGRFVYAPGLTSRPNDAVDTLHTFVVGVDGFLFDQALTPMLSIQTAFTRGSEDFGDVFGRNSRHFLLAVGADFLRSDGLNVGAAINLPINEPVSGISFYMGWYSDIL